MPQWCRRITHNSSDDMGFSKNRDQQHVSLCVAYDVFAFLCNLCCIAVCMLIPISACNDNRVKTVVPFLSFSNILEEERKTKTQNVVRNVGTFKSVSPLL